MQNRFFIVILFTCSFFSAICADDSSFLSRQNDKIQYGLLLAQAQKSAQQTGIIGKKYDVRTSPAQLYKVPHSRLSPEEVVIKLEREEDAYVEPVLRSSLIQPEMKQSKFKLSYIFVGALILCILVTIGIIVLWLV